MFPGPKKASVPEPIFTQAWLPQVVEKNVFHIIGPYNSGTNFLSAIIEKNDIPVTPGFRFRKFEKNIFKHYPYNISKQIIEINRISINNVIFIVMIRDPFRWIDSLNKSPYEMEYENYLLPCRIGLHAINHGETYERHLRRVLPGIDIEQMFRFDSVVEYWNRFYLDFLYACRRGEISAIFLRYEDLVQFTPESIHFLRSVLRLPVLDQFCIPTMPAKDHGDPSGYIEARERLRTYPSFSDKDRKTIRARLSREICLPMYPYLAVD